MKGKHEVRLCLLSFLHLTLVQGAQLSLRADQRVKRLSSASSASLSHHSGIQVLPTRRGLDGTFASPTQISGASSQDGAFAGWTITLLDGTSRKIASYMGSGDITLDRPWPPGIEPNEGTPYTLRSTTAICLERIRACDSVLINFEGSNDEHGRANSQNNLAQFVNDGPMGSHCAVFFYSQGAVAETRVSARPQLSCTLLLVMS